MNLKLLVLLYYPPVVFQLNWINLQVYKTIPDVQSIVCLVIRQTLYFLFLVSCLCCGGIAVGIFQIICPL